MTTLPHVAWPASGHTSPVETRLAMSVERVDLPRPASPASSVNLPAASRPGQSHCTDSGVTSDMSLSFSVVDRRGTSPELAPPPSDSPTKSLGAATDHPTRNPISREQLFDTLVDLCPRRGVAAAESLLGCRFFKSFQASRPYRPHHSVDSGPCCGPRQAAAPMPNAARGFFGRF
jgi:hypothetical protein